MKKLLFLLIFFSFSFSANLKHYEGNIKRFNVYLDSYKNYSSISLWLEDYSALKIFIFREHLDSLGKNYDEGDHIKFYCKKKYDDCYVK